MTNDVYNPGKSAELSEETKAEWALTFKLSTLEVSASAMGDKKVKQSRSFLERASGTYYKAVPAIDASGENILKLVPVKAVNINKLLRPQHTNTVTKSLTNQQAFHKLLSCVNALPNEGGTPATNCLNSLKDSCSLPVTVKSPALPKGQCLQIPANAKVQTLPASKLPLTLKNHIFKPSTLIHPEASEPNVVCVSPVTTVNKGVISSCGSEHESKRASMTPKGNRSKGCLKLVPKASQRPNAGMQWVIEGEEDSEMTPSQKHLNSSVISQIVHTVRERERVFQLHSDIKNGDVLSPVDNQEQDNALVMCNGKVFFVSKKRSAHKVPETSGQQTQTWANINVPGTRDEVIDLCGDEAQDGSPQPASGSGSMVSRQEDDCVIFVSYVPPKAEDKSKPNSCESGPTSKNHVDTTTTVGSIDGTDHFRHCENNGLPNCKAGSKTPQSMEETSENVPRVIETTKNNTLKSPERTSDKRVKRDTDCSRETVSNTRDKHKGPTTADRRLMRDFGITADVKVLLQRIDKAFTSAVLQVPVKNGCLRSQKKPTVVYDSCQNREGNRCSSVTRLTAADEIPFQYAVFNLNSIHCSDSAQNSGHCHSGQSAHTGQRIDDESATEINYLEPIDEDFIDAAEDASVGETKNTNTRRMGRTRKRTMCPCCVPGAKVPHIKK